jgi:hypothetical protein
VNAASSHLADGARYVHGAALTRRTSDAVLVLPLDERAAEPIMLSGTGATLWDTFAHPTSVRAAAAELALAFATDVTDVEVAITPVIAQLVAAGALAEAGAR